MNFTNIINNDETMNNVKGEEVSSILNLDEKLEQNFVQDGHDMTIYDDDPTIQKLGTNKRDANSDSKFTKTGYRDDDDDDANDMEMMFLIPSQKLLPHVSNNDDVEYVYMKKVMRVMEETNNDKNYLLPLEQEESQTEMVVPLFSTYNHHDNKLSSLMVGIRSKVQTQTKRGFLQSWYSWCSRAFFIKDDDKTKYMRFCTIYNHGIMEYGTMIRTHLSTVMLMTYQPSISNFKYNVGCNLLQTAYHKIQLFTNLSSKNACTKLGIKHKYNPTTNNTNTTITSLEYNVENSISRPWTIHRTASTTEIIFSMGGGNLFSSSISKFWQLQFWWKDPSLLSKKNKKNLERSLLSHSIGVLWDNILGLAWTWRLQYGSNAIIDIPIYLSSSPGGESGPFWNNVYFASFLNVFSCLLQKGISTILLPKLLAHTATATATAQENEEKYWQDNNSNTTVTTETKVKQHELQSKLMERKATISRKKELEKGGLIILSAIYGYDNDDDDATYDVTIPLQFWIKDSRLELMSGSSKRHLLGFPDLSMMKHGEGISNTTATSLDKNIPETKHSYTQNSPSSYLNKIFRLIDLFIPTFSSSQNITTVEKETSKSPQLIIRYKFEDSTFQIKIEDKEGLILPSKHAILLSSDNDTESSKI